MQARETNQRLSWSNPMPEEFIPAYKLGEYPRERILQVMWKYLDREQNCRRAWARINHHLPEVLHAEKPLDIVELSTAHGAMLEIFRGLGHNVTGSDYPWTDGSQAHPTKADEKPWARNLLAELMSQEHGHKMAKHIPGWPYQSVIESLDLDVRLFDGGMVPYPFKDNSFDILCTYQAIEAYGPPQRWMDFVEEFCRITRKTIVIGFNPLGLDDYDDPELTAAALQAWTDMQNFDGCGFRCSFMEVGQSRTGRQPVTCKFVAKG